MPADSASEVTHMLVAAKNGDAKASEALLPLLYDELRALARRKMAQEPGGHTLQATALVHEAFLRLLGQSAGWDCRGHFFAAAAEAMRRILVERARRVAGARRGGGRERVAFEGVELSFETNPIEMVALDEALTELEQIDPHVSEVVKLRYFAGLSVQETVAALGRSKRTIMREWSFARAWLRDRLADNERPIDGGH